MLGKLSGGFMSPTRSGRSNKSSELLFGLQAAGPQWRSLDAGSEACMEDILTGNAANTDDVDLDIDDDKKKPQNPRNSGSDEHPKANTLGTRHAMDVSRFRDICQIGCNTGYPRVLCVTRRHYRKNKYVDIVGEYHLELIQEFEGAAIVIPRTTRTVFHLAEYLPMDGLIIAEGNDLSDEILMKYGCEVPGRLNEEAAKKFASDTEFDVSKDELEFALMRYALASGCPILSLCRGSQMLNALRGGTLIGDIETEVGHEIVHLRPSDAPDYDSHRHPVRVTPNTPLAKWFEASLQDTDELQVNSYHHQASKTLGSDLVEMARSPDGIIEAFYDPSYNPTEGQYVVGLQFHPERMLSSYPGCAEVYRDFGVACHAYKTRQDAILGTPSSA